MATPAFGISFGDIVAAVKILNDVRKALRDTGGAKDEFQHVQIELQHLQILLEHLNHGTWDRGGDAGHLNAIKGMASTCQVPLRDFLTKIEKYKLLQSKELESHRSRLSNQRKKMQWAIGMKEEVEKFRAIIVAKVATITLLIQPHIMATMFKIEARSQAILDSSTVSQTQIRQCQEGLKEVSYEMRKAATERVTLSERNDRLIRICAGTRVGVEDFRRLTQTSHLETNRNIRRLRQEQKRGLMMIVTQTRVLSSRVNSLESLFRQLVTVFGGFTSAVLKILKQTLKADLEIYALLREVHFTILRLPFSVKDDSIFFTDALGRTRTLPYEFFQHWEVFESMLKCDFKQKPGEQLVIQGQYHLLKGSTAKELIINKNRWDRVVFPGSNISMSMIIAGLLFQEGLCPRFACGVRNTAPSDGSTLIVCSNCNLEYHCAEATLQGDSGPQAGSFSGMRVTAQRLGGEEMLRGENSGTVRDTARSRDMLPENNQPVVLADEHLIEDELEVFKAIHIQTRSKIETLKADETIEEDEEVSRGTSEGVELHDQHHVQDKTGEESSKVQNSQAGSETLQVKSEEEEEQEEEEEGGEYERGRRTENKDFENQPKLLEVMSPRTPSPERYSQQPPTPESRLGIFIGKKLQLTGILGLSSDAVVYSGVDVYTNLVYAVRAVSKFAIDGKPLGKRAKEVQSREIQLHYMASTHPNIAKILRIADDPDCTYIVMEHCSDGDLFANITEKFAYVGDDESIRTAFLQIADAIEHCHRLGIYHRNIKPENIFVNGPTLALTGFSLATTDSISWDHGCGSLFYMSPECLDPSPHAPPYKTAPNDIWSLGVLLVNLTCGRNPWKKASLEDSTYKAFTRNHDFLRTLLPLSVEFNSILGRIFESDPDKRITISELKEAIVRCSRFCDLPYKYQGNFTTVPENDLSWRVDGEELEYPEFDYNIDEIESEASFNSSWNELV